MPKKHFKAYVKFRFVYLYLSSKTQICSSALLSMRAQQHFYWCKGLKLLSKSNACFVLNFYSSDMTEHVHMYNQYFTLLRILATTQCSLSIPDTGFTLITFIKYEVFTLLVERWMHNSSLFMYFPILGAELITASCKHDLIDKWTSASWDFDPVR